jgi:hypothetical protein
LSLNHGVYIVHITNEKGISQTIKVLIKWFLEPCFF